MSNTPPHPLGDDSEARPVIPGFSPGLTGPAGPAAWRDPPAAGGAQAFSDSDGPIKSRNVQVSSPGVSSPSGSRAVSALVHLSRHLSQHRSVPRVAHRPSVPHAGAVI
jgi:hypothetical protein